MSVIHRYLTTQVLKYFCFVLAAVAGIYVIVDFFEKIDDILDAGLPLARILVFFALRIPLVISQVTPVGLLLAVIVVFGLMVKHNETVALRSGGVSTFYIARPVLIMGLVFGALLFFFSEVLVPITMAGANRIWQNEVKHPATVTTKKKNIWMKGHRTITHIRYFMPSDQTIFGVSVNYFDEDFNLVKRLDAEQGIYTGDSWRLFNVIEQNRIEGQGSYKVNHERERTAELQFVPEDLNRALRTGQEMSYGELSAYIREVEAEGYDATSYRTDLCAKIAFPFVCVIMSMVGTGLALWRRKQEGLAGSIFYGIVWAFFYWILYSFSLSLGYGGMLLPIVAAWLSNGIFLILGGFILFKSA